MTPHDCDRFLGLIGAADPRPVILECLRATRSEVEATLILNSVVLQRDGEPGYDFEIGPDGVMQSESRRGNVNRRLQYLRK